MVKFRTYLVYAIYRLEYLAHQGIFKEKEIPLCFAYQIKYKFFSEQECCLNKIV